MTYASVGHTDAMFFQFFEAQDVAPAMSPSEVARETEAQLELIRSEMNETLGRSPTEPLESRTEH